MIFIIVTLVIIFFISWRLTLVTLGAIVPVLGVGKIYGVEIKKITKKVQDQKAEMSANSEEAISCIRTVKAFSTESFELTRYKKSNAKAFELGK